MSAETQHAIEQVLDLWNIQRLVAASCFDTEVIRAMAQLRKVLYEEQAADEERDLCPRPWSRN